LTSVECQAAAQHTKTDAVFTQNQHNALKRMRWHARRGLLELDIVLMRFIDLHYARLTEVEQEIFEQLLDMPDNSLWDLISGKTPPRELATLLDKISLI
jgi:succinate dehydrogenase flavin-adding protein (antitoxin of CptAB toxin-antitoxin module)